MIIRERRCALVAWLVGALAVAPSPAMHAEARLPELSATQVFAMADQALQAGNVASAEAAYRALAQDPDLSVRNEARFRLAMVCMQSGRYSEADALYRQMLAEEPTAVRPRLERARALERMGNYSEAIRELRSARAIGLPADVAPSVESYAASLRARRPAGFSFSVAAAPDSNVNRATRSDRLQTVIGEFELDETARERSGIGLALSGSAHVRVDVDDRWSLVGRTFASGDFYRSGRFNDATLGIGAGPEVRIGDDHVSLEVGKAWREYGGSRYSETWTITLSDVHTIDRRTRLRASASMGLVDNARNRLQDGRSYSFGLSGERELSPARSIGIWLLHDRQDLRDPGYSTTFNEAGIYAHQRFGWSTVTGAISYGRLQGDERLSIYPRKRGEDLYQARFSISVPRLEVAGFVPFLHLLATRNRSTVELYDFDRLRFEISLARAF